VVVPLSSVLTENETPDHRDITTFFAWWHACRHPVRDDADCPTTKFAVTTID
jgi:hypothetical protein